MTTVQLVSIFVNFIHIAAVIALGLSAICMTFAASLFVQALRATLKRDYDSAIANCATTVWVSFKYAILPVAWFIACYLSGVL